MNRIQPGMVERTLARELDEVRHQRDSIMVQARGLQDQANIMLSGLTQMLAQVVLPDDSPPGQPLVVIKLEDAKKNEALDIGFVKDVEAGTLSFWLLRTDADKAAANEAGEAVRKRAQEKQLEDAQPSRIVSPH